MSRSPITLGLLIASACALFAGALPTRAHAAEATTGEIAGTVLAQRDGAPIAGARVAAASASGRYVATSDARGRFTILGVTPDTYVVSAQAAGFEEAVQTGVVVLAGAGQQIAFRLAASLRVIGSVRSTSRAFAAGSTSDTFSVTGAQARANEPIASSSGLGSYLQGSVQGAIASVPGIDLDSFGNAIPRGGQVDDAAFEFDSVPVVQGLIAEPGGNVTGAQLSTIGVAQTSVTFAGYTSQSDNALGAVIDEIPAVGGHPGHTTLDLTEGIGALDNGASLQSQWASPDLRWRYAAGISFLSQYVPYGDGSTFYASEAGTFGLALQTRGMSTMTGNVHYALGPHDDLSILGLYGLGAYQQYGTPYGGETVGAFNGASTVFPGQTNPTAPVDYASGLRATYDVLKLQWTHTTEHSLARVQTYQSQFGSSAGGPFWDDNGLLAGQNIISLAQRQGGRLSGIGFDVNSVADPHNNIRYGAEYRITSSFLNQLVPTNDEHITSYPSLFEYFAYAADTWSAGPLDVTGALRLTGVHIVPSTGQSYDLGALDPHLAAAYRLGRYALRATFDHDTVAPKPLEVDRTDIVDGTPTSAFSPVAPESADNMTLSFESSGRIQLRATYFYENEKNRIGVVPSNFQEVVQNGADPGPLGVPVNLGLLHAHGAELYLATRGVTLNVNYIRAFSSTANQFALNGLNPAAVAAGALFPEGSVPDLSTTLSYEAHLGRKVRITPSLSYQTGYPYGNGTQLYIIGPNKRPELVPNDNFVNPGYNYYFLRNPTLPFNATTNPYVATLGTPEGPDQNSLRSTPQMLANLHAEVDVAPRVTLTLDVGNLIGTATPTQLLGNPYLAGPPGYTGGNPAYAAAYANALSGANGGSLALTPAQCLPAVARKNGCYVLGNGVPTLNGLDPALPWRYGLGGYIGENYPNARTIQLRLRYEL
jgi:hypothetical protein